MIGCCSAVHISYLIFFFFVLSRCLVKYARLYVALSLYLFWVPQPRTLEHQIHTIDVPMGLDLDRAAMLLYQHVFPAEPLDPASVADGGAWPRCRLW